jgi:5-formyltetrahydrofolate cyclo-ligase
VYGTGIRVCEGIMDHKAALREMLKSRRARLPYEERREKSRKIGGILLDFLLDYDTVMVYVAKEPEVMTRQLIADLIGRGTRVIVPIIQRHNHTLRLSYLIDLSVLTVSTFNVPEPIGNELPADPQDIQATIIPLIGFDRQGNRLGYGAGYYDRFLEQYPGIVKIGVGYACQQVDAIQHDRYDIRLDYIVTEEGIISC